MHPAANLVTAVPPCHTFFIPYPHDKKNKKKGGFGMCVEALWHGSRVSVKQLLPPTRTRGAAPRVVARGSAPRVVSASAASEMRRQVRLLQALRFEFLVPIFGVSAYAVIVVVVVALVVAVVAIANVVVVVVVVMLVLRCWCWVLIYCVVAVVAFMVVVVSSRSPSFRQICRRFRCFVVVCIMLA